MTPERIKEIRAAETAASPGPWLFQDCGNYQRVVQSVDDVIPVMDNEQYYPTAVGASDMRFCALARTAVPELLAEVDRLQTDAAVARAVAAETERCAKIATDIAYDFRPEPNMTPQGRWRRCGCLIAEAVRKPRKDGGS